MKRTNFKTTSGFTLIELIMVIAIIGILAAIAVPKFQDLSRSAKEGAAKGGLGALRSVLAIEYAKSATGGLAASYPTAITAAMFADSQYPDNPLSNGTARIAPVALAAIPTSFIDTSADYWYVTAAGTAQGRSGAYVDSASSDSTDW